jgi:hypothetical protein
MYKEINLQGQKDFQRGKDKEDRSLVYRNWLRTVETRGFWCDVDFIKWKYLTGVPVPAAITDLTRVDTTNVGEAYRMAIYERIFNRDQQGNILETLGKLLKIPVYLVLFPKEMNWVWVLSFQKKKWKYFEINDWVKYLQQL